MSTIEGGDSYRAWVFTLASSMACVFGAALIFIDTIVKKVLGRDVRILQNHKFLAGSLGLGSGVMVSYFYNLLPEAKEQLSSEHSIFKSYTDAAVMVFFFAGVGTMLFIHLLLHQFDSSSNSPGIENTGAIEQFMQRESNRPQHPYFSRSSGNPTNTNTAVAVATGNNITSNHSTLKNPPAYICQECVQEVRNEDDDYEDGEEEEERYNDSEYVDDEVTSLLNNAFLQIGKNPNSRVEESGAHMPKTNGHHGDDEDDGDDESIDVVIADQKDKILNKPIYINNNPDLDFDSDDYDLRRSKLSKNSWSTASTHSQKPFAPISNKKKSNSAPKAKGRKKRTTTTTKECTHQRPSSGVFGSADKNHLSSKPLLSSLPNGNNTIPAYGAVSPSTSNSAPSARHYSSSSSQPSTSIDIPRPDHTNHLRRTSFPRLKGQNTIYSRHDSLDHTVADDREHAYLTQIGIQTAVTLAIHKFPEGLITFLSTTADPCLGLSVFMAISVHNIIEGYLIAFPLYIGLHSRAKAFALAAALGGLSQPLGAVMGWFIVRKVASMGWQVSATGATYAMVAGMMTSITVNGMWPQAVKCVGRNPTNVVQYCFFAGIAIMGICQAVMGKKCDF
ncbi:hypothetical protein BGZ76_006394 [Entomortierella beljakovae]|nr:hypothetical protein BGZ76_006394 [Entomortierella beljakovae]